MIFDFKSFDLIFDFLHYDFSKEFFYFILVSQHVPGTKDTENKQENIDVEELDNTDVEKNEESKNSEDIEDDQNTKETRDNKTNDYVDYWDTKHHKVEQSILVDIDSLSYHQMAFGAAGVVCEWGFVTKNINYDNDEA